MIVIGTAGHIDHGKSSIVRRLTGTDPDRLPEEKARGMTIDLGFAFYRSTSGQEVAFVDVPGHERFVRTMIAGAGGIDAVMLVVAADDGWMPQSEEHFDILKLLRVPTGFIVINKSDLVDEEWLALQETEIRERVKGSFLENGPIIRISAETGAGFEELRVYLDQLASGIAARNDKGKARLYIDRAFVQHGIGGVVTGTLRGGSLAVGQTVSIWPSMKNAKIRSLQSAGNDVEQVTPGSRTACAFTGIDKEELVRGGVISDRPELEYFRDHPVLALQIEMLQSAKVVLEDRRRVVLLVGTSEAEGEIRLFDDHGIAPGGTGLGFFRADEPLYTLVADRVVLRLPTPAVTLGGGMVLDHLSHFPRRRELAELEYLKARISGRLQDVVLSELQKRPLSKVRGFLEYADFSSDQIEKACKRLIDGKTAGKFGEWIYATGHLAVCADKLVERLTTILADKSHLKGLLIDEVAASSPFDRESTEALASYLVSDGRLVKIDEWYNLAGRGMSLKGVVKEAHDKIMGGLKAQPYAPPSLTSFASLGKPYQEAIKFIVTTSEGHKCGAEFILLESVWGEIVGYIRERLRATEALTVADLKDRFGFSRKYAIPILEETDRLKLTRRDGDVRRKGERFEES